MEAMTTQVVSLKVAEVGLDRREGRMIRRIDPAGVARLKETDPARWDPIEVRAWPEDDPYPDGEEGKPYQVVAGYHRVTAARELACESGLTEIKAIVRTDVTDDRTFLLEGLTSNLRHGLQMTQEDKVRALRALKETHGMSYQQLADATGITTGTLKNWLSGRDTNAARKAKAVSLVRDAPADAASPVRDAPAAESDLSAISASEDQRAVARLNSAWNDGMAEVYAAAPEVVKAWLDGLGSPDRDRVIAELAEAWQWLYSVAAYVGHDLRHDLPSALPGATPSATPGAATVGKAA